MKPEHVRSISRPQSLSPGRELELEIQQIFRDGGFRTHINSSVAKPRQTDIAAQGHGLNLLIEVKDRNRSIDVSDIDSLYARLSRNP